MPTHSTKQRVSLLSSGLRDRVPAAKDAAVSMVAAWLQEHCGGDVLRLLEAVDVQRNQGTCQEQYLGQGVKISIQALFNKRCM
jgi:hypothetical protein